MTSCLSYEPAQLVPEITLSAEEVSFFESVDSNLIVDFGLEVSVGSPCFRLYTIFDNVCENGKIVKKQ